MQIKPLGDKVLIQKISQERVSASGLILPEDGKPDQGTVLAIGRDVKHVRSGDTVAFAKRMGQVIEDDVLLMPESAIMGVL